MRGSAIPDLVIWVWYGERRGERERRVEIRVSKREEKREREVGENGELNFSLR